MAHKAVHRTASARSGTGTRSSYGGHTRSRLSRGPLAHSGGRHGVWPQAGTSLPCPRGRRLGGLWRPATKAPKQMVALLAVPDFPCSMRAKAEPWWPAGPGDLRMSRPRRRQRQPGRRGHKRWHRELLRLRPAKVKDVTCGVTHRAPVQDTVYRPRSRGLPGHARWKVPVTLCCACYVYI